MSCITSADGIKLWLLICLVNLVNKSRLVDCQLSRDVTGYTDSKCRRHVLILVLSMFNCNNPLLLAKLSAVQPFPRS